MKQQSCKSCHSEHKGRGFQLAPIDKPKFDHALTNFTLRDGHRKVECANCHLPGKGFRIAQRDCIACHRKDDVHKGSLGAKCTDCHNEANWKTARFDHATTRFPLTGKHEIVKCADCHRDAQYKETPKACAACHRKVDKHKGQFGEKCETCHSGRRTGPASGSITTRRPATRSWAGTVQRNARVATPVPSTETSCQRPVSSAIARTTSTRARSAPSAPGATTSGTGRSRRSSTTTGRPFRWRVRMRPCNASPAISARCSRRRQRLASDATARMMSTRVHSASRAGSATTSGSGRRPASITPRLRSRSSASIAAPNALPATRRRLTPEHQRTAFRATKSTTSTKDSKGANAPTATTRPRGSRSPGSITASRSSRCSASTLQVECKMCHATALFKSAKSDCVACHAKDDKHKDTLGPACEQCHNARSWKAWDFDHDKRTRFVLDGKHRGVACSTLPQPTRRRPRGPLEPMLGLPCQERRPRR